MCNGFEQGQVCHLEHWLHNYVKFINNLHHFLLLNAYLN